MVFQDASQVYECIGGLMMSARTHPEMGPKVRASNLVIRFVYSDPDSQITIDAKNSGEDHFFEVCFGENNLKPDVLMTMKADIAHQFWFGKVNLTAALTRGQMTAKGPIQAILKLLPAIKPAYAMYPEHLRSIGRGELVG